MFSVMNSSLSQCNKDGQAQRPLNEMTALHNAVLGLWITCWTVEATVWARFVHNQVSSAAKEKQLEKSLPSPVGLMQV